jgi:hypothetical protein
VYPRLSLFPQPRVCPFSFTTVRPEELDLSDSLFYKGINPNLWGFEKK